MRKILIVGFSGAGKSTLLNQLKLASQEITYERLDDLDSLVLKEAKKFDSVKDLVEQLGWEKFRLLERQVFEGWIKEEESGVLSLGGGTLTPLLWSLYGPSSKLKFCHIWASFETCWQRLNRSQEVRPLLSVGKAKLETIYLERMLLFNKISCKIENETAQDLETLSQRFLEKIS